MAEDHGRTLWALVVGVDAYPAPVRPLHGCVADATRIAQLLRRRTEAAGDTAEVRLLTDAAVTREAVLAGFREHLAGAGPRDTAVFFYAGHGSQESAWLPAHRAVEPDGLNETLVLADSRVPGGHDLADKELAVLVGEVAARAGHVLVVLDCCHSGSGVRAPAGGAIRHTPADDRPRGVGDYLAGAAEDTAAGGLAVGDAAAGNLAEPPPAAGPGARDAQRGAGDAATAGGGGVVGGYVLLAACRPDQTAKEVSLDGAARGAFSVALERALGGLAGPARYDDVHRWVAAAVRNLAADQSPVLEAPSPKDARRPFLGGVAAPAVPVHTAAWVAGRGWVLDAGRAHGMALGSPARPAEVFLLPAAGGEAVTTARVVSVGATTSLLQVADPLALDEGSVYRAEVTRNGQPGVAVVVTGEQAGRGALASGGVPTVAAAVRERLGRSAVVHVAEAGELEVRCEPGVIRVLRAGLDEEVWATWTPGAGDAGPAGGDGVVERTAVERAAAVCEHVGRWLGVAARANPTSRLEADAVELAILDAAGAPLPAPDGSVEVWYAGPGESDRPVVRIRCANRSLVPLHCAVLVLGDDYGIGCLTVGESVLLRLEWGRVGRRRRCRMRGRTGPRGRCCCGRGARPARRGPRLDQRPRRSR
ncbi:MAG: caspase family protein [Actinobacteria bacterium]|nr:caspase family protein [Actinomycetota bacterium]